jgi:hypothetical protein
MACTAWPKRNFLAAQTQLTIATTGASEAVERIMLRSRGRRYRRRPPVQSRTTQPSFAWAGNKPAPKTATRSYRAETERIAVVRYCARRTALE